MIIPRFAVQIGDIVSDSFIVTYVGRYGYTTLDLTTGKQSSNSFRIYGRSTKLNVTRTGLTTFEQIIAAYPELFL